MIVVAMVCCYCMCCHSFFFSVFGCDLAAFYGITGNGEVLFYTACHFIDIAATATATATATAATAATTTATVACRHTFFSQINQNMWKQQMKYLLCQLTSIIKYHAVVSVMNKLGYCGEPHSAHRQG